MVALFEQAIAEYFKTVFPSLRSCINTEKEDNLLFDKKIKEYPACIYYRQPKEYTAYNAMYHLEGEKRTTSFAVQMEYMATFFFKRNDSVFYYMNVLRQFWNKNSYVYIDYPKGERTKVAIRLTYLSEETERDSMDIKGPQRRLVVKWISGLLLDKLSDTSTVKGFIFKNTLGVTDEHSETFTATPIPVPEVDDIQTITLDRGVILQIRGRNLDMLDSIEGVDESLLEFSSPFIRCYQIKEPASHLKFIYTLGGVDGSFVRFC